MKLRYIHRIKLFTNLKIYIYQRIDIDVVDQIVM